MIKSGGLKVCRNWKSEFAYRTFKPTVVALKIVMCTFYVVVCVVLLLFFVILFFITIILQHMAKQI